MDLGSSVAAVRSSRVLFDGDVRPAVVLIKDGKIQRVVSYTDSPEDAACEVSRPRAFGSAASLHVVPLVSDSRIRLKEQTGLNQ